MDYITANKNNAAKLFEFVQSTSSVTLVPDPDKKIDSLAASYAVASIMERFGKKPVIYFTETIPKQINFIDIKKYLASEPAQANLSDAFMFINNNSLCAGAGKKFHIYTTKKAAHNCTCINATTDNPDSPVSFSQITAEAIKGLNDEYITPDIATALLAGVVVETQNFKRTGTSSETFFCAAHLVSKNANNELINYGLNKNKPEELIKMWGSVAANFSFDKDSSLGWCTVDTQHIKEPQLKNNYIAHIVNEIKNNFSQADVIVLGINEGPETKTALIHVTNKDKVHRASSWLETEAKNGSFLVGLKTDRDLASATVECVNKIKTVLA